MKTPRPTVFVLVVIAILSALMLPHGARSAETPIAPFRFSSLERPTGGPSVLGLQLPSASTTYSLDVSSNLIHWTPLLTARGSGTVRHTNAAVVSGPTQFFRARSHDTPPVLTGDHIPTQDGVVTIHPVNHASFLLGWKDVVIYNDPVGGAAPYAGLPRPQLILVSHAHGDHFHAPTLDALRQESTKIITPAAIYTGLSATLKGITIPLANGQSTNVLGVEIEAVPAYNANHPKGVGNGYVVTIAGRRFYMSGDTEDVPEMRSLPHIDVAFVCMNVPFTMTIERAASGIRAFRPAIVYPYHFRNQNGSFADLGSFQRQVGTDLAIEVRTRRWY